MKFISVIILIFLAIFLFSAETPPTILLKNGLPLGRMMEENESFVKVVGDICLHENSVFLTDMRRGEIQQIDVNSGKRIRTISSLGQGPAELQRPRSLVVRNGKVFVMDQGFCGIKIFMIDGSFLESFKLRVCVVSDKSFDVNDRDEIFVPEDNPVDKTLVSVYSLKGMRLRGLVQGNLEQKNELEYLRQHEYNLRLDRKGNIYILFNLERKIKKYDSRGRFLWERKISDKRLEKYPHDDGVRINERGGINTSRKVFDLEVDDLCRVFVFHAGGGYVMNEEGNTQFLLMNQNPDFPDIDHSLHRVSISRGFLLNLTLFSSEDLRLYHIKEDKK